jgi:hypothetical protein
MGYAYRITAENLKVRNSDFNRGILKRIKKGIDCEGEKLIHLANDRIHRRVLMKASKWNLVVLV